MKHPPYVQQRGVSLIEALVAMAVMSIGMLGLVGLQTSLRSTSDVAKQRSEAVRLAQERVEEARAFVYLDTTANVADYTDMTEGTVDETLVRTNATYLRQRTVTTLPSPRKGKTVQVNVSWTDRTGQTQSVQLSTVVAGIAPELAATLVVPGDGDVLRQPQGRKRGIPPQAKELGGGNSGFIPPTAPTVAWIFNNATGLVSLCTTTASSTSNLVYDPANLPGNNVVCGNDKAILLSGFVRYATAATQPTSADAANPTSTAPATPPVPTVTYINTPGGSVTCVRENSTSGSPYTAYYCAIPVSVAPGVPLTWSGQLAFSGLAWASSSTDDSATNRRVCRYYPTSPYNQVAEPLANQNYLVIAAGSGAGTIFTCPSPTVPHQSAP
jgi:type IV pilus modification protein PilV